MLVKNPKFKRGRQLELKWEATPYGVKKQPFSPSPVYDVVSEGPKPSMKFLHRNFLRPCVLKGTVPPDPLLNGRMPAPWAFYLSRIFP